MDRTEIVIVGGGLASAALVESYRRAGGSASLALLSQEPDLPVHRPPLSKEYLRGDEERAKVFVHPPEFYAAQDVAVRLETRVTGIDRTEKCLHLADGGSLGYGTLVLATGARPRRLTVPGSDLAGIHYLRSLASADRLSRAAAAAGRVVIVGAGFIGVEVAAALTQRGLACTVVEVGPRMWRALMPEGAALALQRVFERKGVVFRFERSVAALQGDGTVESVVLDDGEVLPADLVVAGIGVALNVELAEQAGLPVERGVIVDETFRTADPHIYAIGDVAAFPDPLAGRIHLEHWDNALQQGRALGRTLAGEPFPFRHVAYFFSDLFDLSLHMVGYPAGWEETVVRGDPDAARFTTVYLQGGVVRAALMVNDHRELSAWTERVATRARHAPELVA